MIAATDMERATEVLTTEWQRLPDLRTAAGFASSAGAYCFDDLVVAGTADVMRQPITRNGHAAGEYTFFRRACICPNFVKP